jgi:hypothetical protein
MSQTLTTSPKRNAPLVPYGTPLLERFHASYMPEPNSGCWLWTACSVLQGPEGNKFLRPRIYDAGRRRCQLAHRVAWRLFRGEIPEGMRVCHKCDTPLCVNPDHLFIGTQRDNMLDCGRKGRIFAQKFPWASAFHEFKFCPYGERQGTTHLTTDQARELKRRRLQGEKVQPLADEFDVSISTVSRIASGKCWKYLDREAPPRVIRRSDVTAKHYFPKAP